MPITEETVNDFTRVSTNLQEIRPDLKVGKYNFAYEVTPTKTKPEKGGYPMMKIVATAMEVLTDGNEEEEGRSTTFWLVMPPDDAKGANMQKARLKSFTDAYDLPSINGGAFAEDGEGWQDGTVKAWVEGLEEGTKTAWITHQTDKATGEVRCELHPNEPGKNTQAPTKAGAELDDDGDGGGKPAKPAKVNGHYANGGGKPAAGKSGKKGK